MKNFKLTILFLFIYIFSIQLLATFQENSRRYLSGVELTNSLRSIVPHISEDMCISGYRGGTNDLGELVPFYLDLGANSVASGNPLSQGPSQATLNRISKCIEYAFFDEAAIGYYLSSFETFLGQSLLREILETPGDFQQSSFGFQAAHFARKWSDFPTEIQEKIVKRIVYAFLGSDIVIREYGFIENVDNFRKALFEASAKKSDKKLIEVIKLISINCVLRDEFLSY